MTMLLASFSGILGAAPSLPLVTSPALSTALLQLALQNQTQAQQVLGNPLPLPQQVLWLPSAACASILGCW